MKPHLATPIHILFAAAAFPLLIPTPTKAQVTYPRNDDAPRPAKTPRPVELKVAPGSAPGIALRAGLAEIRLDHSSSRGGAGMTGRLNVFEKFVRFDVRGIHAGLGAKSIKVIYFVEEEEDRASQECSIAIPAGLPAFIADSVTFKDTMGTQVTTVTGVNTITSTKHKHAEADIVGIHVEVLDVIGETIYRASWPEPPDSGVVLPERLRPRIFTSKDGRKLEGSISRILPESVVLVVKGSEFTIPLEKLSDEDQAYLRARASSERNAPPDAR